jgi:hypothetical protein
MDFLVVDTARNHPNEHIRPGRVLLFVLSLLVIFVVTSTISLGSDCVDYQDYIHRAGAAHLPGEPEDVAIVGDYAYAIDSTGLLIFDIAEPTLPQLVGSVALTQTRSVAVQSEYAYVACRHELQVVDVSSVTNPVVVGTLPTPGDAEDVEVVADAAYIAARVGLLVVNISIPHEPLLVISLESPHVARDVSIQQNYAFVADQQSLWVVDLKSYASAEFPPIGKPGPYMVSIVVQGSYAYLLDTTFGVNIYDITDPMASEYVDNVHTSGQGGMEIVEDLLYTGSGPGLEVFDLANPEEPMLLASVNTTYGVTRGLVVADSYAYV